MNCEKCRKKALKAASIQGVSKVEIGGKEQEQIVVEAEGVCPAKLARLLQKKLGHAEIMTVEEVKPKQEKKEPKKDDPPQWTQHYYQYPQYVAGYQTVYEPSPGVCSLM
ncbi:heavy metal-associated isoprenylated plant protein 47-like [Magnolia sinica]|uniref:heavy metal-associated isoprenylated plant protein 47-like n=1 Tax=Magnolia sinica TaxID=86752 RepID=UPI0026584E25|nr:heavy metal-associated isoprenylated plant protein 47-like [Magnolia sinica]